MSIFRFKQFSVNQESSPAKITTDATVFASSLHISSDVKRVLEIGTGTGVLSLMLAQRYPEIEIEALEINPKAFEVADKNFKNSRWSSRLKALLVDFNKFESSKEYDLIFSNPPFFQNNLQSEVNHGKNIAYHTNSLSFANLAKGINLHLSRNGEAHIMLPPYEMSLLDKEMNELGLFCKNIIELMHKPNSKIIRTFNIYERVEHRSPAPYVKIYVRDENNDFHPSYIKLMKDYLTIF
ncbi:methyltransferase [Marivirga harenae]|uniref:tRNA1(Val) (adenine(37)-N6)-methyltransferase n=1 Tax=Marivirga harenae TaxID=2010992 RepID=UPI0026DEC46A|nr:methyltransferase [Marivirga harenae]WKV10902.1 methyltransferase [Marivirga harenae]|tara:strand:+ start:188005 stop:188718 length:714 start_codon:yes stop_codon:yes gene_type:complete